MAGIDLQQPIDELNKKAAEVAEKVAKLGKNADGTKKEVQIGDMMELQWAMNQVSQLAEVTTNMMSGLNSAIQSMSRNVKS